MRRHAFTLIEMMIAITLFSVVMIFLYQSMATLDKSNRFYSDKLQEISTEQSVHTHVMPYVVYFVKEHHLYRVESATKLSYPFESNINALIDDFGEIKKFRLYKNSTHFLLHLNINGKEDNLLKIRHLKAQ
jgi:prepilin-type N-terminal cleavage/methylation domain-containing protein